VAIRAPATTVPPARSPLEDAGPWSNGAGRSSTGRSSSTWGARKQAAAALVLLAWALASCSSPTAPDQALRAHFLIADRDSGVQPTQAQADLAETLWEQVTACTGRRPEVSAFPIYLRGSVFACGSYPGASGCFFPGKEIHVRAEGFHWILQHELTHLSDPGLKHADGLFQRCAGTPPGLSPPDSLPTLCESTGARVVGLPPCPAR